MLQVLLAYMMVFRKASLEPGPSGVELNGPTAAPKMLGLQVISVGPFIKK